MRIRRDKYFDDDSNIDYDLIATISDAMAHPVRLQLFRFIMQKNRRMENVCTKDLTETFGYAQSTISQHMKILVKSGLVEIRHEDKFHYYYANIGVLARYIDAAKKFAVLPADIK